MITYQLEKWDDYKAAIEPLWREHYDELALNKRKPMRPHDDFYRTCEKLGMLQILTVRKDGLIIGYCLTVIKQHPHYADILCGFEDSYYLSKDFRKGMTGIRLITETINYLKNRGAKEVVFMEIESKPLAPLLLRLGFKKTHTVYTKWIGE